MSDETTTNPQPIVEDDSPTGQRYPHFLGVFCDRCGETIEADLIVSDLDDKPTRLGYIRAYVVREHGWSCDERGDFCPKCKPGPS